MRKKPSVKTALAGAVAGAVNGLFGAGGGMVLVPMLSGITDLDEEQIFPASVSIILPICLVSLFTSVPEAGPPLEQAWPYLLGSIPGGIAAAYTGSKIPVKWLHRILGILIIWGGIRYLW